VVAAVPKLGTDCAIGVPPKLKPDCAVVDIPDEEKVGVVVGFDSDKNHV